MVCTHERRAATMVATPEFLPASAIEQIPEVKK